MRLVVVAPGIARRDHACRRAARKQDATSTDRAQSAQAGCHAKPADAKAKHAAPKPNPVADSYAAMPSPIARDPERSELTRRLQWVVNGEFRRGAICRPLRRSIAQGSERKRGVINQPSRASLAAAGEAEVDTVGWRMVYIS